MPELPYDNKDPESIEGYAKKLIGRTFRDVLENSHTIADIYGDDIPNYGDPRAKGGLGTLLEEAWFGYKANTKPEADFTEAGVELKTTPYEITGNGALRAGERLVLSMIDYSGPIEDDLKDSHMWKKCRSLLLVFYLRDKKLGDNMLYPIRYVSLFTPPEKDLTIIENDYRIIAEKIKSGKAEELSESDTFYLGACTKGATALSSIVDQYYPPNSPAKKRAFCFKNSYMTYVLNEYIAKKNEACEPIVKDVRELIGTTLADYITAKINRYTGMTDRELCKTFEREYNNNKAQWTDLSYRMLGLRFDRAEEFRKADLSVKALRIEENGKIKESMSLPPFRFMELISETWEDSTLHNYFDETRFLFVVFKRKGDCYSLHGCQLWNMPHNDLNTTVRDGWKSVVDKIRDGITLTVRETAKKVFVENDLPKKKDNAIIHVRPHASKRYYKFPDGTVIGNGSESYANQLPDGTWMTNHSFWINNDYILGQLDSDLINGL